MDIINLGHIVDTLKVSYNFNNIFYEDNISNTLESYLKFYEKIYKEIEELKNKAQNKISFDKDSRFELITIDKNQFKVMATGQGSYALVLINGDFTISLRKFSPKIKTPVIKVEFRAEYLAKVGYLKAVNQVRRLIDSSFINKKFYSEKIKEIHLAVDIQGYEFTPLDFYRIKSLSKVRTVFDDDEKKSFYQNQRFTGLTFGKGDLMLRIYDKTAEITKDKKKGFIQAYKWQFNPNFDIDKKVWRIEFQIRRDMLKQLFYDFTYVDTDDNNITKKVNLDNLNDVLTNIPNIWNYLHGKFEHRQLTDLQIFEQIRGYRVLKNGSIKLLTKDTFKKRFQKADLTTLWKNIKKYNNHNTTSQIIKLKPISLPEVDYVENAYKSLISTYTKLTKGNFNTNDLIELIHNANKKYFNKNGVSIYEKARIKALDYVSSAKLYYEFTGVKYDGLDIYEKELNHNLKRMFKEQKTA